ncbi:MAG TPA: ribonuclease HI [bacterium]|nr:ribonuclease HI [bacterium]
MNRITIYTDGGCSGNPGRGAWAFILLAGNTRVERSGSSPSTTNNRMEQSAVIAALQEVLRHDDWSSGAIEVFTDSRYLELGITLWIYNWERNNWKTSAKKQVKNQDLWKELRSLSKPLQIRWNWIKAHAGNELNEACDRMVQEAMGRH